MNNHCLSNSPKVAFGHDGALSAIEANDIFGVINKGHLPKTT
jgi:hypothetical protein